MRDVLRVVIAEDNYLVREGTRELLDSSGEVDVVAAVANADELVDAVTRLEPDAVLTDIRMPPTHQMEGIAAAHAIRRSHPRVGVVVLSQHADEAYAHQLLQDGAAGFGYLLKERVGDRAELVRALRETAAGGSVIDPIIVDALVRRRRTLSRSRLSSLTSRELEVLGLMAEGKRNPAIADALAMSESAVEKHINAIFTKLDLFADDSVQRRVAAVLTYLRESD